jgi:hypothetical protein
MRLLSYVVPSRSCDYSPNNVNDNEPRGQRHIRTRIHHLKEAIRDKQISVRWVPANVMHADLLTKCVHIPWFLPMRAHHVVPAPPRS